MARTVRRSTREVLTDARRALGMSQKQFGYAIGASHRTAARWDAGQATPAYHHLRQLAVLLHPHDRALAAEVGGAIDETLESLGLEAPLPAPPAPLPPAPALRPEDLVEIVVLAAVEHSGAAPAAARQWLHAVFKRAHEIGLSTEIAERALRPGAPPAQGTSVRSPRGGKLEA